MTNTLNRAAALAAVLAVMPSHPGVTTDLPTARLRQLRDGHDPDDANAGKARTARMNRLQADIAACSELVVELGRYRILAITLDVRPDVRRLVDREIRRLVCQTVAERDRLTVELRALQTARHGT